MFLVFKRSCSKLENTTFHPSGVINFFIAYDTWSRDLNTDFTLKDSLFGSVKLTKNSDTDKYFYCRCGIDLRSEFSLSNGSLGKGFTIFGVDVSSLMYFVNKRKDILIHGKVSTQELKYYINNRSSLFN